MRSRQLMTHVNGRSGHALLRQSPDLDHLCPRMPVHGPALPEPHPPFSLVHSWYTEKAKMGQKATKKSKRYTI